MTNMNDEERWAVIDSHPDYAVSNFGRVKRIAAYPTKRHRLPEGGLVLRQKKTPSGYLEVTLYFGSTRKIHSVHRLVAMAFLPPPIADQVMVCHRDDNPINNRHDNLFWGSHADNNADKVAKKRHAFGSRVNTAKLTSQDVIEIRSAVANGAKKRALAKAYGVTPGNIYAIADRSTWRWL